VNFNGTLDASGELQILLSEIEEEIRRRAYRLYEQRGRIEGYALNDRVQAEADVTTNLRFRWCYVVVD
jgi:Protein of unknown function (DUF2934)